jgi:hypothetical protein
LEAAVVVYLRGLYEPLHAQLHPESPPASLFPILRLDEVEAAGPNYSRWVQTEIARESATLVLLGAMALGVARNARQWFAAFLIAFGIWDIFFYLSLQVLIGWPTSLLEWDLLFLLPAPWVGPIIAPLEIALAMIAAGVAIWWRDSRGRPIAFTWGHQLAIGAGGLIVVAAFCWDSRNILAGGVPNPFNWSLLVFGEGVGLAAFLHAMASTASPERCPKIADMAGQAERTEDSLQQPPISTGIH